MYLLMTLLRKGYFLLIIFGSVDLGLRVLIVLKNATFLLVANIGIIYIIRVLEHTGILAQRMRWA